MKATHISESARATPPCPHFGPCGGCQLQNLTYDAQLTQKADRLRALMEQQGLSFRSVEDGSASLPLPALQLHPSPPLAYRNRIRLTLSDINCELRAGYLTSKPDSSNLEPRTANLGFLPITQCPIAAPILWTATEALLALFQERRNLWIDRAPFSLDQVELFTTADESQLQISLIVRTSAKHLPKRFTAELASFCDTLKLQIPALTGAGILILPPRSQRSRRIEQPRPGPTWGSPGLTYSLEPRTPNLEPLTYWVPRGAFFQVNRFLLPELLTLVTANRSGKLAWDLYAGVGLFTKALAPNFSSVVAVEAADPSFTALTSGKLPNRQAVKDTTLDFLTSAVLQRERPDFIVLDPPRTGAGREVCELLGRVAAPTLVYVSCSPETLPADLATLTASGYSVDQLHLVDLFPQTAHIETVAILTRDLKHRPNPGPA
jgi:23S rRNA (uracil1939-C5)-methyltransferase